MNILILIPAYNEEGNIGRLTDELLCISTHIPHTCAIHYILQGNAQACTIIEKKSKTAHIPISYTYYPHPLGIGNAYKKGFSDIPAYVTHVITMDADLNHSPKDIPQFISAMETTNADMIIGSRFINGGSFGETRIWKRIISRCINALFTTLLRLPVHDISSGFRLMRASMIRDIVSELSEQGYPAYMECALIAQRKGYTLSEVPIVYIPRTWGTSKLTIRNTLWHYLHFLPRMFHYPHKRNSI